MYKCHAKLRYGLQQLADDHERMAMLSWYKLTLLNTRAKKKKKTWSEFWGMAFCVRVNTQSHTALIDVITHYNVLLLIQAT